ncbi:MAG: FtsX-like permease family protein [Aquabacterium sp.]
MALTLRLLHLSLLQWRHEAGRHLALLAALTLGVALAAAVHLVNQAALDAFGRGVTALHGEPDASMRSGPAGFDEAWYQRAATADGVQAAMPMLELRTQARAPGGAVIALRVVGVDALTLAGTAPALMPQPASAARADRLAVLQPQQVFLNAAARRALGLAEGQSIDLQAQGRWMTQAMAGQVAAEGAPMAVMDVAAAQALFGMPGRLTRIDLRLAPAVTLATVQAGLGRHADWDWATPQDDSRRATGVSRAYRVNLTVLALVALVVGGFMVFTVQSLSVAQRARQLGLMGVLGLDAAGRRRWLLAEALLIGSVSSLLGLALARALAAAALHWLDGDLGAGWFSNQGQAVPAAPAAMAAFGALGIGAALAGALLPARRAQALRPMQALRNGLPPGGGGWPAPLGLALLGAGVLLALLPPIGDVPVAAYAAVAALLVGGIALVPAGVRLLLAPWRAPLAAVPWLALQRARQERGAAVSMTAGVVASVALSAALLVMVSSFRGSVQQWLDDVLPADLYARTVGGPSVAGQAGFDERLLQALAALPGVRAVQASRSLPLAMQPDQPPGTLLARPLPEPARNLPMLGATMPAPPGRVAVYVSEPFAALHRLGVGDRLDLPLAGQRLPIQVCGVWRDYSRPAGAMAMALDAYVQATGDRRRNELALWLAPDVDAQAVEAAVRGLMPDSGALEFAATQALRRESLRIFDRSFAVTHVLQVVAVAIGLAGVAAGLSAQVLARRRELSMLAHLGLARRQRLQLVLMEAGTWLAAGVLAGLLLGAAISLVLVWVVNPQSFHWTMDLQWPAGRLAALGVGVWAAGMVAAAVAAAAVMRQPLAQAVREDEA